MFGYRDIDCEKFDFIDEWLCNFFPSNYPQNRILEMYNCLNDNPENFDYYEKGNVIENKINDGLFPLNDNPLNRISEFNVCYDVKEN